MAHSYTLLGMVRGCWFALALLVGVGSWVRVRARDLEGQTPAGAPGIAPAQPAAIAGEAQFEGIAQLVGEALARRELPGCVVAIGTRAGPLYARAFGERSAGEAMTADTVFDLASLTKPLATAASVALLAERGALELAHPVGRYLPEFNAHDKRAITIGQLLLHTSGLPSVSPLSDMEVGREQARARIAALPLAGAPGAAFAYSDLGFIVLGELVSQLAGVPLDVFARRELFEPLAMRDTAFGAAQQALARTAPTEWRGERAIRGVAGHAGLFSSATDVGRFAQMLLRGGELDGARVLSPTSVAKLLHPRPAGSARRALGWDVSSRYSHGRGQLLSPAAVGHGGYTGTSLWIDPAQDLYVALLSNRVHAGARGTIHPLASSIADVAVRALRRRAEPRVRNGIDVLHEEAYARLRGRKLALLTHAAARDREGVSTLERLGAAPGVSLRAILSPEHGLSGTEEGKVRDQRHGELPVYSLFGSTRRPTPAMLRDADTIVIDLVDVGTRFYTYMATALATIEVAAELGLPVFLLDRPNPIDGVHVEGPLSEPQFASFVNYHPLPLRHGMTAGELAHFLLRARGLSARLHVVRSEGWRREQWSGDYGARWSPPSPNLGTGEQALLYPALGLVEGTNLSVGRGTNRAFRVVGAPFLDRVALARALSAAALPGLRVRATRFRPKLGPHAGKMIAGVEFTVTDPKTFSAARTGLTLLRALMAQHMREWDSSRLARMVGHHRTLQLLRQGAAISAIEASWSDELTAFAARRATVLLY